MNRKRMSVFGATIISLVGVSISSDAMADFTIKSIVRCDKGMNVQDVLDRNILGLPMELRLVGPCTGFEITHDDVSIAPLHDHSCPGAIIEGSINTVRARSVELRCLTVTGSEDDGITITGGNVNLEDMEVSEHDGMGILVEGRGDLDASGGSIHNNGEGVSIEGSSATFNGADIRGNGGHGLAVMGNSTVFFGHSSISNNDENGIYVFLSSSVEIDNAMITTNGSAGIAVYDGSVIFVENTEIDDNGQSGRGSGIFMRRNATAEIFGGTIAGNMSTGVGVMDHSYAEISDGTQIVENGVRGIRLRRDSGILLSADTNVPANGWTGTAILCDDKESSAEYDPDAVTAGLIGPIDCPDVEF